MGILLHESEMTKAGLVKAERLTTRASAYLDTSERHGLSVAMPPDAQCHPDTVFPVRKILFEDLADADLHPGCICEAGATNDFAADPLARVLPVGNQGGIRARGSIERPTLVVLKTNWQEPEWPDYLDRETRTLEYFGDNRKPGSDLHRPRGNRYLVGQFQRLHNPAAPRQGCAPFLLFDSVGGRDVRFIGIAAPGAPGVSHRDDLAAFWSHTRDGGFLNYRAVFTLLPDAPITRPWIRDLAKGTAPTDSTECPPPFQRWVETGHYT
jgi:hypothetical protein